MNLTTPTKLLNRSLRREDAVVDVDLVDGQRLRIGLKRRPDSAPDGEFVVVQAIAFDVDQARELVAAIRAGILEIENAGPTEDLAAVEQVPAS